MSLCTLTLVVGFCSFLTATVSDLKNSLNHMNKNFETKKDRTITTDEHTKMKRDLLEIFRYHFEMKELNILKIG